MVTVEQFISHLQRVGVVFANCKNRWPPRTLSNTHHSNVANSIDQFRAAFAVIRATLDLFEAPSGEMAIGIQRLAELIKVRFPGRRESMLALR